MNLDSLKFDENGLIPAIVQDAESGRVLTLAYMNRESLEITLAEGYTCFWSRSRKQLWRKGETSGNVQRVVDITADCDADALVVRVHKAGPACHLGTDSCFENRLFTAQGEEAENAEFSIDSLYDLLVSRNRERPANSYTTYLFEKGKEKILKKVGEECSETIIAAKNGVKEETVGEISDLIYHLMVMMAQQGIPLEDVMAELDRRSLKIGNLKTMKQVDRET